MPSIEAIQLWLRKPTLVRQFSTCGRCNAVSDCVAEIHVRTVTHNCQRVELCKVCLREIAGCIERVENSISA